MAKTGIIGIGKLGICFALNLEKAGYSVVGVDIDENYIAQLNEKKIISSEPLVEEYLIQSKNFTASVNISDVVNDDTDIIFIMVATPSLPDGSYDHSQVEKVTNELIAFGKRNITVDIVIGCTVMPGYCNALSEKLKKYNYRISYNPEFIAQGSIIKNQQYPDQILVGEANKEAGDKIEAVLKSFCKNEPAVCRMNLLSAEIAKLATNCFLTAKISFANSIGDLAIKAGADADKILNAVGADSRIGKKYLNYGFGFGGPCFPRDNRALNLFASQNNYELLISSATDEINKRHLAFQVEQYLKQYAEDETIIFDYVTYKKDSVLLEESQQLSLAVQLAKAGRKITIKERPEVITLLEKNYPNLFIWENTNS